MKNKFNFPVPEIKEIMADKNAKSFIENSLFSILGSLDIDNPKLVQEIIELASTYKSLSDYESKAHEIFERKKTIQKISRKLDCRAEIIYSQIQKHLQGESVLDFGCGNGKVAERVSKISKMKVTATDIYKHDNIGSADVYFLKCDQISVPINEKFDNTLLLTVLHHADDSIKILYNRVFHFCENEGGKVVVPYNHNTINGWKNVFENCGLKLKEIDDKGFDQPLCPEYHVLFLLEV